MLIFWQNYGFKAYASFKKNKIYVNELKRGDKFFVFY